LVFKNIYFSLLKKKKTSGDSLKKKKFVLRKKKLTFKDLIQQQHV